MKKLLFVLCALLLTLGSSSSQSVDSVAKFWGIPFGSSKQEVKKMMQDKKAVLAEEGDRFIIWIANAKFAGFDTNYAHTSFTNEGEFSRGVVAIPVENEKNIFVTYSEVKDLITRKYGNPARDIEHFDTPYSKGDGNEVYALKMGRCKYASFWNAGKDVSVIVIILDSNSIAIYYQHNELNKKALEQDADKRSEDL